MSELMRCPFCNGWANLVMVSEFPKLEWAVECSQCPAKMSFPGCMECVISAWNRREGPNKSKERTK